MSTVEAWLSWLQGFEPELRPYWERLEAREEAWTARLLDAFHQARIGQHHFAAGTGYGYHDLGREALEKVFAALWGAEAALVRQQITSGTQAINLCLQALAKPGREVLFAGEPYDTLRSVTGMLAPVPGSLRERGIQLRVQDLQGSPETWPELLAEAVQPQTQLVYLQRSAGYSTRPALNLALLAKLIAAVKARAGDVLVFVDNCYGEFVEEQEPASVGADLMAGSLIKNPGGGLAPCGGYAAGRRDLIERVAAQLFAPGLAGEIGPSLLSPRLFFQGFFLGPHLTAQALRGAILCARAFEALGFDTTPAWHEPRTDLVQRIRLGNVELLQTFCQSVQAASPVDSHLRPEPAPLPGYDDQIIMAGGTFIQGSSAELSADAPLRPPYAVYWQGGLSYAHARLALARVLAAVAPSPPG